MTAEKDDDNDNAQASFQVSDEDGVVRFEIRGQLSEEIGRELRKAMIGRSDEGKRRFVVDISALEILVSLGLGILMSLNATAAHREARLAIVNKSPFIRKLLRMTRIDQIIPVAETPDSARAAFPSLH